jgi:hypothetical protein
LEHIDAVRSSQREVVAAGLFGPGRPLSLLGSPTIATEQSVKAMQQPVSISLDLTAETAYVAYRLLRSGSRVAYTRHVNDVVKADFDVDLLMLAYNCFD